MQRSYIAIGSALVVLVIGLSVLARFITAPPAPEQSVFPDRLNVRVQLPKEELNEERRVAYYAEDNTTLESLEVEYKDGFTGQAKFRTNGTIATYAKYFPRKPYEAPQAHTNLVYAEDGIHIDSEERFYRSGALKRKGTRIGYGNFVVAEYAEGNSVPTSESIFDFDGHAYKEFERHANGEIAKLVRETKEVGLETFRFGLNGVKTNYHSLKYVTQIVWETYREDGENLVHRFEQKSDGDRHSTSYAIHASYYGPDGIVYEERKFTRTSMTVVFKDKVGNVIYRQLWKNKKAPAKDVESFEIDAWYLSVVYLGPNMSNSFWFDKDSGTVYRTNRDITINDGSQRTEFRWYRPDGSLSKLRTPNLDTGKFEETLFEPGETSERFNTGELEGFTDAKPFVAPPQLTALTVILNDNL